MYVSLILRPSVLVFSLYLCFVSLEVVLDGSDCPFHRMSLSTKKRPTALRHFNWKMSSELISIKS